MQSKLDLILDQLAKECADNGHVVFVCCEEKDVENGKVVIARGVGLQMAHLIAKCIKQHSHLGMVLLKAIYLADVEYELAEDCEI